MLKELVIEVVVGDRKVTLELGLRGDGVQTVHAYHEPTKSNYLGDYKLLMKDEEGHKNRIGGNILEKEQYMNVLVQQYGIHHWDYQNSYTEKSYYPKGSPGYEQYDKTSPFMLDGLAPGGCKNPLTKEQADDTVRYYIATCMESWIAVEEYELNELGHVYTLNSGLGLVVRGTGEIEVLEDTLEQLQQEAEEVDELELGDE